LNTLYFQHTTDRNNLIELVKKNEGFESRLYKCSKGKLTIGYGFNLDDCEIPKSVAESWLIILLDNLYLNLSTLIDFFDKLDGIRQNILIDIAYNIGISGLLEFKKMLKYLEKKDYEKCAEEMKNSNWYNQVPNRADILIKMMITGKYVNDNLKYNNTTSFN